ncbi:MAG: hypothetical protein IRZ14_16765 [Chloroflexi bacterium]|nr:hypothetical protein [Chloroflexota bacterium]
MPRQDAGQTPGGAVPAPPCDWYLAGMWESDSGPVAPGEPATPVSPASLTFRQFGSYLVGTHADETITYYGRCTGDHVDLEVWNGWEFVGRQVGRIAPDGQSITLTWVEWGGTSREAPETFIGRARRLR